MAAPVTHIVIADKILKKEFSGFSRKEFLVGTSFPDIRHIKVIERTKTHFLNPTTEEIKKQNSAMAGMMFHSFVDEAGEKFMMEAGLYELIPRNTITIQARKLLEDEIFYDRINDWSEISSYFDFILPEESAYGISEENIMRWHNILKYYLVNGPSVDGRKLLFKEIDLDDENSLKVEMYIAEMRENGKIVSIIKDFYEKFGV